MLSSAATVRVAVEPKRDKTASDQNDRSAADCEQPRNAPITFCRCTTFWRGTPEEWPEAVDLIFVTEFGRPVNLNSLVYKHFKPILKKASLPNIRLYDLRHTAATLALTVGVSPKVVSEQLGHTSAAFTLDVYSHVLPHMQDDAAAKVEAALMG
jgi:integrase